MAKKDRAISVLLIDDKEDTMFEFKVSAQQERIIIKKAFKSAASGKAEFIANPGSYDALILDAKAFRHDDQAEGTENFKSLRDNINWIRDFEKEHKRKIPFCIYTGHIEDMGEAWEDDIKVFVKGWDQPKLFKYLKTEVNKLPETKIITQYYDALEIFDLQILDDKYKTELIHILKDLETNQKEKIESYLGHCRRILEGVYKKLGAMGRIDEQEIIRNGQPNLEWCQRYITGLNINGVESPSAIVPEHIGWSLKIIKEIASSAGSHDYRDKIHNYSLKTVVFALLDVLLWLKKFANSTNS